MGGEVLDRDRHPGADHAAGQRVLEPQPGHGLGIHRHPGDHLEGEVVHTISRHHPGHVGSRELPCPVRHDLQRVDPRGRLREQAGDLRGRRQPPFATRRLLVEPGVLDGHAGGGREGGDDPFVLVGEVGLADLLGQVEVPEDLVPDPHRHPEERAHGRVVRREAVRRGVLGDVVQPQRLGLVDDQSQQPVTDRQVADLLHLRRGHSVGDEQAEPLARPVAEDTEGGVLRAGQVAGDLHDPLQQRVQGQVGGHRAEGLEQQLPALALVEHAVHPTEDLPQQVVELGPAQRRPTLVVAESVAHSGQSFRCLLAKIAAWVRLSRFSLASIDET
jgi:hypothetical protein